MSDETETTDTPHEDAQTQQIRRRAARRDKKAMLIATADELAVRVREITADDDAIYSQADLDSAIAKARQDEREKIISKLKEG